MSTTFKRAATITIIVGVGAAVWLRMAMPTVLPFLPAVQGKTWVQFDPVQCGGNPWEQEMRQQGIALDKAEYLIIKDYYHRQGVEVFDVKMQQVHDMVCQACSCPRGDRIYLLVENQDVEKILQLLAPLHALVVIGGE